MFRFLYKGELSEFGSRSPSQPAQLWDTAVTQDFRPNYREESLGRWLERASITAGSRGGGSFVEGSELVRSGIV